MEGGQADTHCETRKREQRRRLQIPEFVEEDLAARLHSKRSLPKEMEGGQADTHCETRKREQRRSLQIPEFVEEVLAAEEIIVLISLDVKGAFDAVW